MFYAPHAHYWTVGADASRMWSSASAAYVAADAPAVAAWVAAGNSPTRIASEEELREVLASAGVPDRAPGYVPATIEMWQAHAALKLAGKYDAADAAITASGSVPLQMSWGYGNTVRRDSPSIAAMGAAIGLTPAQIDELFRVAATLKA